MSPDLNGEKKINKKGIFRTKQSVCEEWKRRAAHQRHLCQRSGKKGRKRNCQSQAEFGHANENKEQRFKCSSMIQLFFFFLKYRKRKLAALGWHILKAQVGREAFVVITSGWGTADGKIQTHSTDKKPLQTIKQPMTKLKLEVFLVRVEVNSPSPGQSIQEGSNLFWLESTPCNNTRLGFAINTASWNLLFWNMLTTTSSQRNLNKRMTRVWWCVMMSV